MDLRLDASDSRELLRVTWYRALPHASLQLGEMRCLSIDGQSILIARTATGFFAADEMCTHEEASLCLGALVEARVKCPLHGSWFDLRDGSISDPPATEPLAVYPVRLLDDWLEVQF